MGWFTAFMARFFSWDHGQPFELPFGYAVMHIMLQYATLRSRVYVAMIFIYMDFRYD